MIKYFRSLFLSLGLLSATSLLSAKTVAYGEIEFSGTVIPAACQLEPSTAHQVVELDPITTSKLRQGEKTTPREARIRLTNCSGAVLADLTLADANRGFAKNGENPGSLLTNVGSAKGVGVEVKVVGSGIDGVGYRFVDFSNEGQDIVPLAGGGAFNSYYEFDIRGSTAAIPNAQVTAGSVKARIKYTITYK